MKSSRALAIVFPLLPAAGCPTSQRSGTAISSRPPRDGNQVLSSPAYSANQKALVSGVSREQLAAAPHFSRDNWSAISSPAFASKVYQYYGKQAWFQTGGLQPTGR